MKVNINPNNINDDLLVSYLLGEADEAGKQQVEAWIKASEENEKYFRHFKSIWDESQVFANERRMDTNDAWQRLVNRTIEDERNEQGNVTGSRTIPFFQRAWVRVAAMLILFLGVGGGVYLMKNTDGQMLAASAGDKPITHTLPDGSIVVLNKNSTVTYPSAFKGNTRNVKLTGEAFFDITPNKSKPFIIDANATSIKVVGTSFNVKTTPESTEVIVETGIVEVSQKQKSVRLLPNQKTIMVAGEQESRAEANTDELYSYYRTGQFICTATPLHKLTEVLSEAYGEHIVITDSRLRNMPITATFKNEPLEQVLDVVAETMNVSIGHSGSDILIGPAGAYAK
jgi:ferric-dicitrate binding protein FerR (iron transport regulator)